MRWVGRMFLYLCIAAIGGLCLIWAFGPREPVDLRPVFDPASIGDDPSAYLAEREMQFDDITPGVEKRIIWADGPGARTALSIVYVHGFSATSQEIRPVPDELARALGANLVYTRLTGHGRGSAAMAEATVADWMRDMAEALEIGRRVGERVVVLSTSTGGTLAALAAQDPEMSRDVAGMIFVSPNFAINSGAAPLLTLPAARYWLRYLAGKERCFEPRSPEQERFWTTCYPVEALLPMAAVVKAAYGADFSAVTIPALFRFSDADKVIKGDAVRAVADRWGGPVTLQPVMMGDGDDPYNHVIAGDILSPGATKDTVTDFVTWIKGL